MIHLTTLGGLTVLQAHMNPDLVMGDELLKKTGSGNVIMVFGEPDIEVKSVGEGRPTTNSAAPSGPTSATKPGRGSTPRSADPSPSPRPARSAAIKVINHYGDELMPVFAT